jgi:hypothetical protein
MKDEEFPTHFGVVSPADSSLLALIGLEFVQIREYCEIECDKKYDFLRIECVAETVKVNIDNDQFADLLDYLKVHLDEYQRIDLFITDRILFYENWNNIDIKTKDGFVTELEQQIHSYVRDPRGSDTPAIK